MENSVQHDYNGNGESTIQNGDTVLAIPPESVNNNRNVELVTELAEREGSSGTIPVSMMDTSHNNEESSNKTSNNTSDSASDASSEPKVPTTNKKRKKNNGNAVAAIHAPRHHQILKKTLAPFVQTKTCEKLKYNLGKCLDCLKVSKMGRKYKDMNLCRFQSFRKLRYTERGGVAIAGFPDIYCENEYTEDDFNVWRYNNPPERMSFDLAKFLLQEVGDHFCDLVKQEKITLIQLEHQEYKMVTWRRVLPNSRESCDVCLTTLFNYHWTCGECGFSVCVSCFKARRTNSIQPPSLIHGENKDSRGWMKCRSKEHVLKELMLTQIVVKNALDNLWTKLHQLRRQLQIPSACSCEPISAMSVVPAIFHQNKATPVVGNSKESNSKPTCDNALNESDCSDDDDELFQVMLEARSKIIRNGESNDKCDDDQNKNSNNDLQNSDKDEEKDIIDHTASTSTSTVVDAPSIDDIPSDLELKNFTSRDLLSSKLRTSSKRVLPKQVMTLAKSTRTFPDVPHAWMCSGFLLRLMDPLNAGNLQMFQEQWKRGQPVMVSNVGTKLSKDLWSPESFARDFGHKTNDLINCMTGKTVPRQKIKKFWDGFEHVKQRLKDEKGNPMLLKLKDWPPGHDFAEMLPDRFEDLMAALPLGEYTHRDGILNLAARLPDVFCKPDLGPKMYIAYGSGLHLDKGTTNLHLDVSDAVNVMVHVGVVKDEDNTQHDEAVMKAIEDSDCDIIMINRVKINKELPGALWHIWEPTDADKIRDMMNKISIKRGIKVERHHDAIHDQSHYLDSALRKQLRNEYNVIGYPILQCEGDAVFIPAGAPHQVRNLNNCIKVAEDFVSPENVGHCFHLTEEFRDLTETHTNHEDKLQIKNIVYHTVKDAVAVIDAKLTTEGSA